MGKLLDKFPSFFFKELRFLFQLLSITYLWYVIEIVLQKVKGQKMLHCFFPSRQQVKIDFGLALQIQKIS